ncbi:MAG TPA: glycosyltransferase [Tepidisphaeraceae bacterium]|jgi:glycosyltransferase involved in cell wall biosynthesis
MVSHIVIVVVDLHGGAGIYCRILAQALKKNFPGEFEISLLVLRTKGFLPGDEAIFHRIVSLEAQLGEGVQRVVQVVGMMKKLKTSIDQLEADCALCVGTLPDLLVPLLCPRLPAVLTVHGNYSHLLSESRLAWLLRPLLQWRFSRQMVVAPARGVAEDLQENFGANDVRVIWHGVDAEEIARRASEQVDDLPRESYLIAVGRLARQKDYPTLLRAYALARSQGLDWPLVIVGDGPDDKELRAMTERMRLSQAVRFLGHRDNPFPYMQAAQCLVLSSAWEGFGLVLIEAMSLGVPIISTDCPSGPAEILDAGKFGMLTPVGDSERLAEAMLRMSKPETREHYSELAKERSKAFAIAKMAEAYRTLLKQRV